MTTTTKPNVLAKIGPIRQSDSRPDCEDKKVVTLAQIRRCEIAEHEAVIERGLATFIEVGRALMAIRDGELYQDTHKTFTAYCRDRFDLKKSRAYQLIDSAVVVSELEKSTIVDALPKHEAHVRPLVAVTKGKRAAVWNRALEIGGQDADGVPRVIAAHVQAQVDRFLNRSRGSQHRGGPARVYTKGGVIHAKTGIVDEAELAELGRLFRKAKKLCQMGKHRYSPSVVLQVLTLMERIIAKLTKG